MVNSSLIERDLRHIWHPCSQMKDYESFPPLEINSAEGCYLYTSSGQKVLDAISSWWSKSLGHQHPKIMEAVTAQLKSYAHVIGTNTCQKPLVELSELICEIVPTGEKVFFSGDGSCAVEISMKMALHAKQLLGQTDRTRFLALANGYHGETGLALSVSDLGIYKAPYESVLQTFPMIEPIYVQNVQDPLWHDCSAEWPAIEVKLNNYRNELAAIIFEPILQGAGGMKMYSADFLNRLCTWAKKNDIYVIADEIMTGIGRTGKWLASEYANIAPDFVCLSKGITSGFCAFSVVTITNTIYDIFYHDYDKQKNFLHSQTYSGNALGAAAALATLRTIIEDNLLSEVGQIENKLLRNMQSLANANLVHNIRGIGAVVAADLVTNNKRLGFEVFKKACLAGAFLRPLGNTIYWIPPFTINDSELLELCEITREAILKASDPCQIY